MSFLLPLLPHTALKMESVALCMLDQYLSLNHTPHPDVIPYITSLAYSLLSELGGGRASLKATSPSNTRAKTAGFFKCWDVIRRLHTWMSGECLPTGASDIRDQTVPVVGLYYKLAMTQLLASTY